MSRADCFTHPCRHRLLKEPATTHRRRRVGTGGEEEEEEGSQLESVQDLKDRIKELEVGVDVFAGSPPPPGTAIALLPTAPLLRYPSHSPSLPPVVVA